MIKGLLLKIKIINIKIIKNYLVYSIYFFLNFLQKIFKITTTI